MVRDTPSSQDASTHQIWNSYLKEYGRYALDTKRDGPTDGRTDSAITIGLQSSFGGIKINETNLLHAHLQNVCNILSKFLKDTLKAVRGVAFTKYALFKPPFYKNDQDYNAVNLSKMFFSSLNLFMHILNKSPYESKGYTEYCRRS